jgi:HSP20 family protein
MKVALRNQLWPSRFDAFDRILNDTLGSLNDAALSAFVPQTDVAEDDQNFYLHLSVPGFEKDNFKLAVENCTLTISGERRRNNEENGPRFHQVETRYGQFSRSFRLPETVKTEEIAASYNNGLLQVTLPKAEPTKVVSEIKVN